MSGPCRLPIVACALYPAEVLLLILALLAAPCPATQDPTPRPGSDSRPEAPPAEAPPEPPASPPPPSPRLWQDLGVAASGSLAVAFLKPDIRRAILHDARFSNVAENFIHPVRQVRRGTERDSDPFWVNNVAHPGLFALEALYLKRRGYRDGTAFLFTQVHSVLWEFAIEGSAFEPSGKDLLTDAAGAAGAVWVLRPLAARADGRIASGRGRWWDHVVRWLDPVSRVAPRSDRVTVSIRPRLGAGGASLEIAAEF